jgi:hypothetical protein
VFWSWVFVELGRPEVLTPAQVKKGLPPNYGAKCIFSEKL